MPPRIPEEAVEKALKALEGEVVTWDEAGKASLRVDVEIVLAAAFEALGMTEERQTIGLALGRDAKSRTETRLVSAWVPVSGEQTDNDKETR